MNSFEQDKAAKLNRIMPLRIANALGMVAWQEDAYHCAAQKLRMLHPLSWPWLIVLVIAAVVMHGVIEVAKELKFIWRDECVWW